MEGGAEGETKKKEVHMWAEIRLAGKLPERRSNHAAFIANHNHEYLYIHGGRDLKEGAMENLWRLDLEGVRMLY